MQSLVRALKSSMPEQYIGFYLEKTFHNEIEYQKKFDWLGNYSLDIYIPSMKLANFILATSHNGIYREMHTEVAEYLGVTYRHLLYVIAKFVKQGILEKSKKGYLIKDEIFLRKIATTDMKK